MKAFWRRGGGEDRNYHLFTRTAKNSNLGMVFSSLCWREWISTIQEGRPKPYPPEAEQQCKACLAAIPKGCKT
jgi:hypothetical protein